MSRRRSRTRSRRVLPMLVVILGVVLLGGTLLPAASYSTGTVDRGASVGVTDDPMALLALDTAAGVTIGQTDQLVVVTNNLESAATVTLTLDDDSATKADLVVDGTTVGDAYTVDLARSASVAIDVAIPADASSVGDDIVFDVSADSSDVDAVVTNRRAPIEEASQ